MNKDAFNILTFSLFLAQERKAHIEAGWLFRVRHWLKRRPNKVPFYTRKSALDEAIYGMKKTILWMQKDKRPGDETP